MNTERILVRVSIPLIIIMSVAIGVGLWGGLDDHLHGSLADYYGYMAATRTFLATGEFYSPFQLAGSYDLWTLGGGLYPPTILWLLVPFAYLPAWLWWAVPIVATIIAVLLLRPARWTLVAVAAALVCPRTGAMIWFGNPGMWLWAALSWGLLLGWPAALVLLKPSLLPFALVGSRRRTWWIAAGILLLASLPLARLWLEYPTVLANGGVSWSYSWTEAVPLAAILVIGMGRDGRPFRRVVRDATIAVENIGRWARRYGGSLPWTGRP